jgi:ABC-2 type transport system ATP-binding protein
MTQTSGVKADRIGTLSHGYRQRVGIAQAIVHRPQLLVLDEPISGLDPVQIVEMRNLLKGLKERHTIVLSSHILSEISETCDRILVIKDGEIAASGTEAELSKRLVASTLEVVVKAMPEKGAEDLVQKTMRAVHGVVAVDRVADEGGDTGGLSYRAAAAEAGTWSYRVASEEDVRAPLIQALVHAGVPVLELKRSARELETVFIELANPKLRAAVNKKVAASAAKEKA